MAEGAVASEAAPARGVIRVESGFYTGLEWPLDHATTVIGRGRTADLVLHEATISRAHALFGYEGNEVFVQDLDSTNGTMVNGERARRTMLADGDEVRMGKLVLRFSMSSNGDAGSGNGA